MISMMIISISSCFKCLNESARDAKFALRTDIFFYRKQDRRSSNASRQCIQMMLIASMHHR